ncbi:larval/pupal cuticle protein H1C-like [Musca vetustissima]|uniref:larval/pupal cuticle protein H1C-like n=1 Tax=Musca vetustissima TaxID=27455 RepID=UPI002AB6F8D5|nr:larval/pupal cuticle protein H1C-like [Musca vetustissima]
MAFKFVVLSALLAVASAGFIASPPSHYTITKTVNPSEDAVAQTHESVVRSYDGTVSQYSKSVHTPYSSVHKEDTRINNNVYAPKTITYTAPAVAKTVTYAAAPTVTKTVYRNPESHEQQHTEEHVYAEPAPTAAVYTQSVPTAAVYTHATPAVTSYTHHVPTAHHTVYTHAEPTAHPTAAAVYQHHEVPSTASTTTYTHQHAPSTTTYNHGPAATTYSHNGHGVSAYGSSQTVHYSPAHMVSHMSFDGFGTHWGY